MSNTGAGKMTLLPRYALKFLKTLHRPLGKGLLKPCTHRDPHQYQYHSPIALLHSLDITRKQHFSKQQQSQPDGDQEPTLTSTADIVNDISRLLNDHRSPHHELELSLHPFRQHISTNVVEQVLKRCKNLGFAAQRFFVWSKSIPGLKHSLESHHILVNVLGTSKQFTILWDFLIEMRDTGSYPITPHIFWLTFRAYSAANLPADAIRAFTRMVEFGIKPDLHDLDKLVFALCKRKHVKHAQQFFDQVKNVFQPHAKTYSILIKGWGDLSDSSRAHQLFDEMIERGCSVDVQAYNSLLDAHCREGHGDEASRVFQQMVSCQVDPDAYTYSIFLRSYCEANDFYSVFNLLDRMRRYSLVPNAFTYNCIIKKLCKNDKVEDAYQLLDEMIGKGVKPDAWSYNAIQAYHCDHCEVNKALKLMSKMEKDGCLPDRHTYNMVLKLLIKIGRFDKMEEVWESMGDKGFYPSISTYAVMIHGLCKKKGKLEEACKYFEDMIDEGIPPYISTVELLRNRLVGLGLLDWREVIADKMDQSTSSSVRELADTMRGKKAPIDAGGGETYTLSLETDIESE